MENIDLLVTLTQHERDSIIYLFPLEPHLS